MSSGLSIDSDSLGEICATIIKNDELSVPYVFEDVFKAYVLPLLVRPWDKNNLIKYREYVVELTNELRIISREKDAKVVGVVPALYPRPYTTVVGDANEASVSHLAEHIYKENTRSPFPMDHLMTDFLNKISIRFDVEDVVLKPLALLLAKYGRVFEEDDGTPLYALDDRPVSSSGKVIEDSESQDSFSDEYED